MWIARYGAIQAMSAGGATRWRDPVALIWWRDPVALISVERGGMPGAAPQLQLGQTLP